MGCNVIWAWCHTQYGIWGMPPFSLVVVGIALIIFRGREGKT